MKEFYINSNASDDLASAKAQIKNLAEDLANTPKKSKMYKVVKGALEKATNNANEQERRYNDMISRLNTGNISGWLCIKIALYEDKKTTDQFCNIAQTTLFRTYDDVLDNLNADLKKHFPVKTDTLTSGDYFITGEFDEYNRYYMVSDCTDLGHDWDLPILRYRVKDKELFYEVYVKPICKS